MDDERLKALISALEDELPKYRARALSIGRDQWREHSSQQVLNLVGDEYSGGLLPHSLVEQLLDLLEVDPTAQYVLLAHNKTQEEFEADAELYTDTSVELVQFAAPRISADRSVTGRSYTLYMDRCAACLKADCRFVDCPGNFFD